MGAKKKKTTNKVAEPKTPLSKKGLKDEEELLVDSKPTPKKPELQPV